VFCPAIGPFLSSPRPPFAVGNIPKIATLAPGHRPAQRALTMAEDDRKAARQRASFARADRLKKETAQAVDEKEKLQKAEQQKRIEANKAAERQEKQRQTFEQRKAVRAAIALGR
jgi:hypothetical protein